MINKYCFFTPVILENQSGVTLTKNVQNNVDNALRAKTEEM